MKALLSIKPEFVEKIISGEKQYEYRKRIFKKPIDKVVVYSTKPVGKIICEFSIEKVINDSPSKIWNKTWQKSGISEDFFYKYFENKSEGYALKISNLNVFDEPLDPNKVFKNFFAPQSFKYIENNYNIV